MKKKYFGFGLGQMNYNQQRLYWTVIFLVRLLVLSIPLYFVLALGDLYFLQIIVADQTNYLLTLMGFPVSQEGFALLVSSNEPFRFFISEDSTGWKSMLFYAALVMAVPNIKYRRFLRNKTKRINAQSRIYALAIGLPVIWAGNLMRVLGIVLIQQNYGFGAAMLFHDYFYRVGLVGLMLIVWFLWLRTNLINKHKR